jgi:hypothetical protein
MDPTVWGPKLWLFIHTIALNFPDKPSFEDVKNYEMFFENLKYIIPCEACRLHYTQRLSANPVSKYLTDANTLFIYTIDLHNEVNKSLKKKIYSYEEVAKMYRNYYNKPYSLKNVKNKIFNKRNLIILLVIIAVCVLIKVYRNKYNFRIIKSR